MSPSIGHSQECQNVADAGNFYIQQGSGSFCVNCPVLGASIQWTIGLVLLADIPSLDYTVLPNNSLLMRSSQEGAYQCGDNGNTHQFRVTLAGE